MSTLIAEPLERYAARHSTEEPALLARLAAETRERMAKPEMLTGRVEGTFLRLLVRASGARRVLELGTFTGYSALMMAAGLPEGGRLVTCEVDESAAAVARRYFAESENGDKIEILMGPATETIGRDHEPFDLVFLDADKANYPHYFDRLFQLLRPGGVLVADNTLWGGEVLDPKDEDARAIVEFNRLVHEHPQLDHVLLTVRDGIVVAIKGGAA